MVSCEGCISYTISDKTGKTISKFRSDREAIEFARGLVKLGYGTILVIDDQTDEIIAEITPTKDKAGEA